jgi:hypothetical protein
MWHFRTASMRSEKIRFRPYTDAFAANYVSEGKAVHTWDILFRPAWRVFRGYFLKQGVRDGWQGFYLAFWSGFSNVTRYLKAEALSKNRPEEFAFINSSLAPLEENKPAAATATNQTVSTGYMIGQTARAFLSALIAPKLEAEKLSWKRRYFSAWVHGVLKLRALAIAREAAE